MGVDLVLHIILDMARHKYDGLPHKKHEHPAYQSQREYQCAKKQQARSKQAVYHALPLKTVEQLESADVIGHQIERDPYDLRRQDAEYV